MTQPRKLFRKFPGRYRQGFDAGIILGRDVLMRFSMNIIKKVTITVREGCWHSNTPGEDRTWPTVCNTGFQTFGSLTAALAVLEQQC